MKAYSFYFNASDWLASPAVKLMSKAERGVYIQLLALAWGMEQPGTLPASADKVRRLAEMSPDEWAESSEVLLEKFPLSECGTYRYNPRLVAEAEKEQARSEKNAEAGRKSAEKRAAEKAAAEAALQRKGNANPTGVEINPTGVAKTANENPTISKGKLSKEGKEKQASSAGQDLASPVEDTEPESPTPAQRPTPRPKLYRYDNAPVFLATEFHTYLVSQGYGYVEWGMYLVRITDKIKNILADPQQRKLKQEATNDEWKAYILTWLDGDKRANRLLLPDAPPQAAGPGYQAPNTSLQLGPTTTSANYGPERFAAQAKKVFF